MGQLLVESTLEQYIKLCSARLIDAIKYSSIRIENEIDEFNIDELNFIIVEDNINSFNDQRVDSERGRTMSFNYPSNPFLERLVKSSDRVRDLGEVFTPSSTVQEMLDLLPKKIWNVHPSTTFLEPSCGDGNFLVAILDRKLERLSTELDVDLSSSSIEIAQFHSLEAIASIYAIDISSENIIGGVAGHEIGARTRLLALFSEWHELELGKKLTPRSPVFKAAKWIVEHNLIVGNMLASDSDGKPTGRENIPLIEYKFDPTNQSVTLFKTTLGDVISIEESKTGEMLSLFPAEEPKKFWTGKALSIGVAEMVVAPTLVGPARNGIGRRK
jgi:hypothetical protein